MWWHLFTNSFLILFCMTPLILAIYFGDRSPSLANFLIFCTRSSLSILSFAGVKPSSWFPLWIYSGSASLLCTSDTNKALLSLFELPLTSFLLSSKFLLWLSCNISPWFLSCSLSLLCCIFKLFFFPSLCLSISFYGYFNISFQKLWFTQSFVCSFTVVPLCSSFSSSRSSLSLNSLKVLSS